VLNLQVLNQCNQVIKSFPIGPFSSNTSLGTIKVSTPAVNRVIFSGTVKDCNNAPVAKGLVSIYAANGQVYTANIDNGNYQLAIIKCDASAVVYSVTAIDLNALQQNVPVTVSFTSGSVNVPIQSCGTSSVQFMEILIDGVPYNIVSPPDRLTNKDTEISNTTSSLNINGGRENTGGSTSLTGYINMTFEHNRTTANGLPIKTCTIFINQTLSSQQILTPNPTINLTKYGSAPGSSVEGNFEISMNFQGTPRTVRCNFRVIKN